MDTQLTADDNEPTPQLEPTRTVPSLGTTLKITGALAAIGGISGAGVGVVLTYVGNVVSGYPIPPSLGIYAWNASAFAVIGATFGPPMVWSLLRTVPLWRTLVEPAVAAVAASVLSMLFLPEGLFPLAVIMTVTGAALRLRWVYRGVDAADEAALLPEDTDAPPRG